MTTFAFTTFPTVLGACGIAWRTDEGEGEGGAAIVGVQLPDADPAASLARMAEACPQGRALDLREHAPPPPVARAMERIAEALAGTAMDLSDVPLDMGAVSDFHRRVYEFARRIPPGHTLSYGEVAQALGDRGLSRAVGQALGHNPFAPVVPCHRVLAVGGKAGGFSAPGGARVKLRMLAMEGAYPGGTPPLFDDAW